MNIVEPVRVTDADYIAGNLGESEYPEWEKGKSYKVGDYRTILATHSIYQCLRNHTSDETTNSPTVEAATIADPLVPDPDPLTWIYVGSTQKWRLFDGRPSQTAAKASSIEASVKLSERISALGLLNLEDASTATVQIIKNGDTAHLSWTTPSNGGSAITGYQYRYRENGKTWSAWTAMVNADASTTFYTVKGLNPDSTYEFEIRAVNTDGNGKTSNRVNLVVNTTDLATPPSGVSDLSGASGDGEVTVSWSSPADDGGSQVTGFEYVVQPVGAVLTGVHRVPAGQTEVVVSGLQNGVTYNVVVRAVNAEGAGPFQATPVTVTPGGVALSAPVLTATAGVEKTDLTWTYTAPANPDTIIRWEYRVRQSGNPQGKWTAIPSSGPATRSYSVTSLRALVYEVQVRAVSANGFGPASDAEKVTPSGTTPSAPSNFSVSGATGSAVLKWDLFTADGGATVTKWQYRYATTSAGVATATWTDMAGSGPATVTHTIENLLANTAYYVQIRAVNGVGNGTATSTLSATTATTAAVPFKPTLSVVPGNAQAVLSWVSGGHGGSALTKWQYRQISGTQAYPTMAKFSRGSVNGNSQITTFRSQCVSANEDSNYTPPDPITSDYTNPPAGSDYIIRQRFIVKTDKKWNRITLSMPHGCDDALSVHVWKTDAQGVIGANNSSPYIGGVVQAVYTANAITQNTNITADGGATDRWGDAESDGYWYVLVEAYMLELGGNEQFRWQFGWRDTDNVTTAPHILNESNSGLITYSPGAWTDVNGGASASTLTKTGLTNGTLYKFQVRAVNSVGNGALSDEVEVIPRAASPPSKPAGLTGVSADKEVILSWTAQDETPDITSWEYKLGTDAWREIVGSSESTTTVRVTGLQNGVRYSFRIRAVNSAGNGATSDHITVVPITAPPKPLNLSVIGGASKVTIGASVPDNGGATISKWQYRQALTESGLTGAAWTDISSSTGNSITGKDVASLTNGTPYWYQVRAVNSYGFGVISDAVSAVPGGNIPQMPDSFQLERGNSSLAMFASTHTDNGSPITKWQYRYGTTSGTYGNWTDIASSAGTSISFKNILSLTNGTTYYVQVRAVNANGNSLPSPERSMAPSTTVAAVPSSITGLAGSSSSYGAVRLTTTGINDGGSTITLWEYFFTTHGWRTIPGHQDDKTLDYTIEDLPTGSRTITVRARNRIGISVTAQVTLTVLATAAAPPKPQGFTAAPGDGEVSLSASVVRNNGGAITKWQQRHKLANGTYGSWTDIASSTGNSISAKEVTSLVNRRAYTFQVRAVNSAGNSPESDEITVQPMAPLLSGAGTWDSPYRPGNIGDFDSYQDIRSYLRGTTESVTLPSGAALTTGVLSDSAFVLEFDPVVSGTYRVDLDFLHDEHDLDLVVVPMSDSSTAQAGGEALTGTDDETVSLIKPDASTLMRVGLNALNGWDSGEPTSLTLGRLQITRPRRTAGEADESYSEGAGGGQNYNAGDVVGQAAPDGVTDLAAVQHRVLVYQEDRQLIDDSVVFDWWSYYFAPARLQNAALFSGMPASGENDILSVNISGGNALECGQVVFGLGYDVGYTQTGDTGFEGLDFSHVETNIYGDLVTVEREATEIHRFDLLIEGLKLSEFATTMHDLKGGKRGLFIGDVNQGSRAWAYGFARDWNVYWRDGTWARARLIVQGVV